MSLAFLKFHVQIPDPNEMPPEKYREVRNLIEQKVKELLASL